MVSDGFRMVDLRIHLGSVEGIPIITTTAKASGVRKSKALLLEEAGSKRSEIRIGLDVHSVKCHF